ncbi:MAG: type III-B CRISPR module-associated Cmr3 family protein, partial [Ktedonobacteraceae bacterium]
MTTWIIEPRDPLLVRDGRPFGPDPGARATSLPFPFPSTLAGGIRTRAGVNEDGIFQYTPNDKAALQHLKTLRIRGPLLVQLTADGGDIDADKWLLPAPHDAQLFPTDEAETANPTTANVRQLVPLAAQPEALTDLDQRELWFVGHPGNNVQSKPLSKAPTFWYWQHMKNWLLDPTLLTRAEQTLSKLGLNKLESERRLHVSIDAAKGTAKDGMLFETSGLEFTAPGNGEQRLQGAHRLALVIAAEDNKHTVHPGVASFGGERRLVTWRKSSVELPTCPEELAKAITDVGHCRV